MTPVGSVEPKLLSLLGSGAAVNIFRELLWAEAARIGLGPSLISVPGAITVADGGVDAEINASIPVEHDVLFSGIARYQIKTGSFSAGKKSEQKDLLLNLGRTDLHARVRSCFEKGGTLVAVLFGAEAVDPTEDDTENACRELIAEYEPRFRDCHVRILRQNQIAGLLNRHLSLSLQAQMKTFPHMRVHRDWPLEIELTPLVLGPEQEAFISKIRQELRIATVTHICVWGEPGVGKTRLLFEAARPDDLAPDVVYFRTPRALEQSGVVDELVRNPDKSAICIVDDCDPRERERTWSQLRGLGTRVRLVTVQHDAYESSGNTIAVPIPLLPDDKIAEIIQQSGVMKDDAERYAPYCGGSPRVAQVVGWNLQHHPDDLTKPLDTGNVWDRFIEAADDPNGDMVRHRKVVLSHIALFTKFGYGGPYQEEARAIARLIESANAGISWDRFQEIVHTLRQRRILQGETTLYITPRLLHIKLWRDWWEVHGALFSAPEFLASVPETLHQWFFDMFAYAHGSQAAKKAVATILGQHGAFLKQGLLRTELGGNFFLNLTEADTETALEFLEHTVGRETREELLSYTDGRQWIVWSLEKIAVERRLFSRAARLLARLAEAENNPRIGNNARGTFAALFSLGPGRTAPTQAPPAERLPVLAATLSASSKEMRLVALRACDVALESTHFSRAAGAERRGLQELELWSPKTYGEWHDAYVQVWNLLRRQLDSLTDDEQQEAAKILLGHSYALLRIEVLQADVTQTVLELARKASIPRKILLEHVLRVLEHPDDLPDGVQEQWKSIEKEIIGGDDYAARLRRNVTLPAWHFFQGDGISTEVWAALAAEGLQSKEQLRSQFQWLLTNEAESAAAFGYELGRCDTTFSFEEDLLKSLTSSGQSVNFGLLGGYLRAMHDSAPDRWLSILERLASDSTNAHLFPGLIMQSGLTDGAADILTRLARSGAMRPEYLQGFSFGREVANLSIVTFRQWVEFLLQSDTQPAVIAALRLLHSYYANSELPKAVPPEIIERVLLHNALFAAPEADVRAGHLDFDWSRVTRRFLLGLPERRFTIIQRLIESMGEDSVVLPRFATSESKKLLTELSEEIPHQMWMIASPLLGPPIDARAHSIKDWLAGTEHLWRSGENAERVTSILHAVPIEDLWAWVDAEPEPRAWYLASFVPKDLLLYPEQRSIVRELLIRYGDRDDVQRNLIANFSSEGWAGSESEHYRAKISRLKRALESEAEPKVREWLHRYIRSLERSVESARNEEEREDR